MSVELKFLGTGGAFDYDLGNSAAYVTLGSTRLLIDCGHTVYPRLRQLNLVESLDAVLITHLHDDHAGSLSTLLYHRHFFTPKRKLRVFVPDSFRPELLAYLQHSMQNAEDYASFEPLSALTGVEAIETTGLHVTGMTSFAFLLYDPEQPADSIAYSGDLGDGHALFNWLAARKATPRVVYHDVGLYPNIAAHAHYKVVAEHCSEFSIIGYHQNHRLSPPDNPIPLAALQPGLVLSA